MKYLAYLVFLFPTCKIHASNFDSFFEDFKDETEPSHLVNVASSKIEDDFLFSKKRRIKTALDVGAGTGRDTFFLLNKGWDVTAIDGQDKSIDIMCSRMAEEFNSHLKLFRIEFENLHTIGGQFDLVVANWSIDYTDPEKYPLIFDQVRSKVLEGGYLAVSFFGNEHTGIGPSYPHTLHKESEILPMIGDSFELKYFNVVKQRRSNIVWHVIEVVAKKVR